MEKHFDDNCLFCQIAQGKAESVKLWENEDFIAIENKFPESPIHILVIPKWHIEKSETREIPETFWNDFMAAVMTVVKMKGLDKEGYIISNNGAGYNHFEHEHMHIQSGLPKLG